MLKEVDKSALIDSVENYLGRSVELFNQDLLDIKEEEYLKSLRKHGSGFSFPTNEGMRKITKTPEVRKIEKDPILQDFLDRIRLTIRGVENKKEGGLYSGVNAFHHGHLAYLSKSEAILNVDYNKLVPFGFGMIIGLVGAIKKPEDFKRQVSAMAVNPAILEDLFSKTKYGPALERDKNNIHSRLLRGLVSVMNEFNPRVHGQDKIPPVFCEDQDAYNYFRYLILQNKVAGLRANLKAEAFIGILETALDNMGLDLPEINTLYVSSCYDPRFLKPLERKNLLKKLKKRGHKNVQLVESFLNSGWVVYDVNTV